MELSLKAVFELLVKVLRITEPILLDPHLHLLDRFLLLILKVFFKKQELLQAHHPFLLSKHCIHSCLTGLRKFRRYKRAVISTFKSSQLSSQTSPQRPRDFRSFSEYSPDFFFVFSSESRLRLDCNRQKLLRPSSLAVILSIQLFQTLLKIGFSFNDSIPNHLLILFYHIFVDNEIHSQLLINLLDYLPGGLFSSHRNELASNVLRHEILNLYLLQCRKVELSCSKEWQIGDECLKNVCCLECCPLKINFPLKFCSFRTHYLFHRQPIFLDELSKLHQGLCQFRVIEI